MYYIISTSPIEDYTVMFYWTYENAPLNVAVMSNNYYFSHVGDDKNHYRIYINNTNTIPHHCVYDDKHPLLPKEQRLCADFEPIENKLAELVKSNLKEKGICSCVIA